MAEVDVTSLRKSIHSTDEIRRRLRTLHNVGRAYSHGGSSSDCSASNFVATNSPMAEVIHGPEIIASAGCGTGDDQLNGTMTVKLGANLDDNRNKVPLIDSREIILLI